MINKTSILNDKKNNINKNINEKIIKEQIINQSNQMAIKNVGLISKKNSHKLSNDSKQNDFVNVNREKKDRDKNLDKLKVAQTILIDFIKCQISIKKKGLPKLCKIC